MTIHAMAPDTRDVTSGSITWIFRSIVSDPVPTTADDSPPGNDASDEKPGEVCTPASSATHPAQHDRDRLPNRRRRILLTARAPASNRAHLASPRGSAARGRRLASLGRFTC